MKHTIKLGDRANLQRAFIWAQHDKYDYEKTVEYLKKCTGLSGSVVVQFLDEKEAEKNEIFRS